MSTEQRDIRSIGTVHALDDLLTSARLLVGNEQYSCDDRVILDGQVYLHAGVALDLGGPDAIALALDAAHEELVPLGLAAEHLEFAVILSSSYLRIAEVRHRMPLMDLVSADKRLVLSTPPRPKALRTPRSGCTIQMSVHLAEQRPQHPLKPWRLGSWISRSSWGLTTEQSFTGFTPKPLTPERKKELGVATKAMRYVTLLGSPLEPGVTEDSVELWLDAELLAKISANPKTKQSIALQRQLFVDAVAAVATQAQLVEDFDLQVWDDVKDTLLGRVVSLAAPNLSSEVAREAACRSMLEMVKSDVAQFMTYVEQAAHLAAAYEAGLDG